MKEVFANEIRHLRSDLRRKMLMGTVSYRDQEKPIQLENEHDSRMQAAGLRQGFGGSRNLPVEYRVDVLARDNLGRAPHFNRIQLNVEG